MIAKKNQTETRPAEEAVIGSILLNPTAFDQVRGLVTSADFLDDGYRKFFETLSLMADADVPINDMLSVVDWLRRADAYDLVGGAAGIQKAFHAVPHAAHAVHYANQVARDSALRRQVKIAERLKEMATDHDGDPTENRQWIESQMAAFGFREGMRARSVTEIARESIEEIDRDRKSSRTPGVMTGFYEYDRTFGALMCGELIVIAARPSIGKTALGLQIAEHAATKGKRTLVVSLEMRDRELVDRMLSKITGIDGRKIRARKIDDSELTQLRAANGDIDELPMFVWAPHAATISQIRGLAKLESTRGPLEMIVVDYIGLVKPTDRFRPRNEQVADVSACLKSLAKELNLPVVALCQLNREAEANRPTLANLRESGAIEQDADVVMFLHKERRDAPQAEWIVAKARNGETGHVMLNWESRTTRFWCPNEPQAHGCFNEYNNS